MEQRWRILFAVAAGVSVAFLDATIVNVAFPDIIRSFPDASRSGLSWVLSGYNIVFAALLIPSGRLADVLGQRQLFLGGLALFTAASALCAVAQSDTMLVGWRVVQAVGAAALIPASRAFILTAFPPEKRASAIGVWAAIAAFAAGMGPGLGGLLIQADSWRLVFLVNLPIGVLVFLYGWRVLPETRRSAHARVPDFLGALLLIVAVGSLALGIVQGRDWGWSDPRVVGSFVAAIVLLPAVVWRSARHPAPVLTLSLFRSRALSGANAASLLFGAAFYGLLLCNALFLTAVWHYSLLKAGLALTPAPFTAMVFAIPAGRLADRFGHRAVAAPGALLLALGCTWYITHTGSTPHFLTDWLPGAVLGGAGVGCTMPMLSSAAVSELAPQSFAAGSAMNSVCLQMGAALGVALLVAIIGTPAPEELVGAFHRAWTWSAIGAVGTSLACVAMGRALARSADDQQIEPVGAVAGRS